MAHSILDISLDDVFDDVAGKAFLNKNNPSIYDRFKENKYFSNNISDLLSKSFQKITEHQNYFDFLNDVLGRVNDPGPADPIRAARDVVDEEGAGGVNWADVHLRQRLSEAVVDEINGLRGQCGLATLQVAKARIEAKRGNPVEVEYVGSAAMWDALKLACGGA